jgi:hypothetical protein
MSFIRWIPLAAAIAAVSGCADDSRPGPGSAEVDPTHQARVHPMPPLGDRIDRVLDELGPDAAAARTALRMQDGRLVLPRRQALAALGPRARATLHRHNVRIEQLARFLEGGVR